MERARLAGTEPVRVPREILDGLEAVRRSGLVNMLAHPEVADVAERMGLEASARWVRENPGPYSRAVFHVLRVADEEPTG